MSSNTIDWIDPRNPYFHYDIDKFCGICTRKLLKDKTSSINDELLPDEPTKVYQVLESVSTFKLHENGPMLICSVCFANSISVFKFQKRCSQAQAYFEDFMRHQEQLEEQRQDIELINTTHVELQSSECDNDVETENADKDVKNLKINHTSRAKPVTRKECKVCHKIYRADNMSVHMRIHTGVKPYKCKYCDAAFSQWTTLRSHTRIHENDRCYLCKFCGRGFFEAADLRRHERTHTGEKPFRCNYEDCEMAFADKKSQKNHYLVHTKERLYTCEYCAKSFGRKNSLNLHLKIHTGETPHECKLCGKGFIQRHTLISHVANHNKNAMEAAVNSTEEGFS